MSNEADSSPAVRSPWLSNRMISRRVGSDNALNTWFRAIIRVHSHGQRDYLDRCLIISSSGFPVNGGSGPSGFLELDPARASSGRHVGEEIADERVWVVGDDEGMERTGSDELLGDSVLEECGQRVEVAVDVEDADRLLVDPECAPAQDFENLLERADPAG